MKQIVLPIETTIKALGVQKITNTQYRYFSYISTYEVDDGKLLYNHMTKELLLLSHNESEFLDDLSDIDVPIIRVLIEKWFFVPVDNIDHTLYMQIDNLMRMITNTNGGNVPLTQFAIYPTTDCNARCFYCFELGIKRINMSEQTARDVVEFINKKCKGKDVGLIWFGGEPLYNSVAMDIICSGLQEKGITYASTMTSNGYLFDKDMVKKANELWHLKKVQITLDGTEEVYNKTKAYIYKNVPSPFKRVLDNIELLLKENIRVNIRLNMDNHNFDDLFELFGQIWQRFNSYDNYSVYPALLFEDKSNRKSPRSETERKVLFAKYYMLQDTIREKGLFKEPGVEFYKKYKQCMADDDGATTILPDGRLGKCEHHAEDLIYGSIYSDDIDYSVIQECKKIIDRGDLCYDCAYFPCCQSLAICEVSKKTCSAFYKEMTKRAVYTNVMTSYKKYKEGKE